MTDLRTHQPRKWSAIFAAALFYLLGLAFGSAAAQEPFESVLTAMAQQSSKEAFSVDLQFVGTPRSKLIVLGSPNRIAIDLFDTVSAMKTFDVAPNGIVAGLRQGLVAKDRYRLIFDLKRTAIPEVAMANRDGKTVLTLKISASDAKSFRAALAARPAAADAPSANAGKRRAERSFTVVIDPGHGGVDTGATGKHGTLEKDVNLKFALALRDSLARDERIKVIMTRADDTFVSLTERSAIARRAKANLFVSMHSDSIRYGDLRGATVYTLSEKASDSLSREIADSENSADRFVDPQWRDNKPEVFDILIELMRRETESLSEHFAAGLVSELGRHDIRLIRNPKRSAGFKVLMAPDVPSVLVEIGYLSNVDDEQLLLDESWRLDTANAIASAVRGFLNVEPIEARTEKE